MKESERQVMERSLIGCMLLDSDRCVPLAVNEGVEVDWFTDRALSLSFYAIKVLWTESSKIDYLTVSERARRLKSEKDSPFAGVELTLFNLEKALEDTVTAANFEYYINLARAEVMFRRVEKAHERFAEEIRSGVDVAFAVENLNRRIVGVLSGSMGTKTISVYDVCAKIENQYLEAHQKRIVEKDLDYTPGIRIPWKPFNFACQGLQEGLVYLGARPSVGKTAFILNLVRAWCESGVKVAFNSLDMAVVPMMKRPIGELARVSVAKSSFGTTTQADLQAIHEAIYGEKDESGAKVRCGVVDWPLTLISERNVDVFRSWCVAMHQIGKLDVAIVDFVQLMGTKARYSNDNEKIEYISGVLKSIANDLAIPVIALSQLNRACEDDGGRVPTASDLRGSGALEQDATMVWILHVDRDVRKTWYTRDVTSQSYPRLPKGLTMNFTEDEFKGITPVRLILAKNQNGQAGQDVWFPFVFFKKYCFFMLGDYEAVSPSRIDGAGVTAKTVTDDSPKYARVTHDWRNDPYEIVLKRHGCLIGEPDKPKQETMI